MGLSSAIRRAVATPLTLLWLQLVKHLPLHEPWRRYQGSVSPLLFSQGSINEFEWYFERPSTVHVADLDALCEWLLGCAFATDEEAFGSPDFWQHPADFETTRRGDCEDHALWAWRKLAELGIAAEFVAGRKLIGDGAWEGHAWVHLRPATDYLILDASSKDRDSLLMPQSAAAPYLRPHFAVDHAFTRHIFQGWLLTVQERARHDGSE